jgi:hypothetical protein
VTWPQSWPSWGRRSASRQAQSCSATMACHGSVRARRICQGRDKCALHKWRSPHSGRATMADRHGETSPADIEAVRSPLGARKPTANVFRATKCLTFAEAVMRLVVLIREGTVALPNERSRLPVHCSTKRNGEFRTFCVPTSSARPFV